MEKEKTFQIMLVDCVEFETDAENYFTATRVFTLMQQMLKDRFNWDERAIPKDPNADPRESGTFDIRLANSSLTFTVKWKWHGIKSTGHRGITILQPGQRPDPQLWG